MGYLAAMNRIILFRWIKIIVLLYSLIGIALYYLQERFLFHPEKLEASYRYHFSVPFEELNIPFNTTDTVSMVKFFPADSVRKGVVLYFHGNRENISRYAKFADNFTKNGYEVWMEDYPGYGKSVGERTEKKMYQQALQIERMALSKYGKDSIILYGKSFGTGIASYVAAVTDCKRLILETPYSSIPDLFSCYAPIYPTNYMSHYRLPVYEYLAEVKYPISIFQGTDDGVVPYRCAAKLKGVLKPTDQFITIDGGTHQNLNDFPVFHHTLDSLLHL